MGIETAIIAGGAAVGAFGSLKQGQMKQQEAIRTAADMEVELEARNLENAANRLNEQNQRLQLARDFDVLRRQQNVAFASTGFMGNSFSRIQAADLSRYSEEQMNREFLSNTRESIFKIGQQLSKNQIAAVRRSGNFAAKSGMINALGGIFKTGGASGIGGDVDSYFKKKFDNLQSNSKKSK